MIYDFIKGGIVIPKSIQKAEREEFVKRSCSILFRSLYLPISLMIYLTSISSTKEAIDDFYRDDDDLPNADLIDEDILSLEIQKCLSVPPEHRPETLAKAVL